MWILFIISIGYNATSIVKTHEFTSFETCMTAVDQVKQFTSKNTTVFCIRK